MNPPSPLLTGLTGKIALITGASSGIGRATALALAQAGAHVVLGSRNPRGNEETLAAIAQAGGVASYRTTDVTRPEDIEALVRETVERHGRIDVAVNNAGLSPPLRPLHEYTLEQWDEVMNTNLRSVWLCMKYELGQMVAQKAGAIVNMASLAGIVGQKGMGLYSASKHGVIGLTRTAALDYAAKNVRVNAVCPGVIGNTEMVDSMARVSPSYVRHLASMHPVGRLGLPEEVAHAVVWLCSDQASFVTGLMLSVDGGLSAGRS